MDYHQEILSFGFEPSRNFIVFRSFDRFLAFDIHYVKEVLNRTDYRVLPHTPSYLLGVINYRGQIVPLCDLVAILDPKQKIDSGDIRHLLVTQSRQIQVALAIGSKSEQFLIKENEIEKASDTLNPEKKELISGQFYKDKDLVQIVNIRQLFQMSSLGDLIL